jgi:hypothetical protein
MKENKIKEKIIKEDKGKLNKFVETVRIMP